MGVHEGALDYHQQARLARRRQWEIIRDEATANLARLDDEEKNSLMTTDPEEGRRQIEAMQPEPLKVGDKVRLKAGEREMTVAGLEDYGNQVACEWYEPLAGNVPETVVKQKRDTFPAASLVRV